jgi:hypothetical protein
MDVTPYQPDQLHRDAKFSGLVYESATDGMTALAGGGQTGATQLSTELGRVATVATAGDSVMLPPALPGLDIIVTNHGANAMQVYGQPGDTINDVATATGVSQMAGSECIYACYGNGKWYVNGLGTGYAGSFETTSTTNGLTAGANSQGSQTVSTMIAVFSTVGASNGTTLPVGVQGMSITIINNGANSINVFPDAGSKINALSANTAFAQNNTTAAVTIYYCAAPGQWFTK